MNLTKERIAEIESRAKRVPHNVFGAGIGITRGEALDLIAAVQEQAAEIERLRSRYGYRWLRCMLDVLRALQSHRRTGIQTPPSRNGTDPGP